MNLVVRVVIVMSELKVFFFYCIVEDGWVYEEYVCYSEESGYFS